MLTPRQIAFLLCGILVIIPAESRPKPDGGDYVPLPGPGLSYGGIPYGSVSGDVANYRKTPSYIYSGNIFKAASIDYSPIQQYL